MCTPEFSDCTDSPYGHSSGNGSVSYSDVIWTLPVGFSCSTEIPDGCPSMGWPQRWPAAPESHPLPPQIRADDRQSIIYGLILV